MQYIGDMKPRLNVHQLIRPIVNKYQIFDAGSEQLIAMAQQKRLAFKERVSFFADESKNELVCSFRAEKVIDVHGTYFIEDKMGKGIGSFKKQFQKSLINSTWTLMDAEGKERFVINETSQTIATLRRFVGWIPFVGEILEIIFSFVRYEFQFKDSESGEVVGKYKKTTIIRDRYQFFMNDEAYESLDWRVYGAFCVALDALQSR